MNTKQEEKNNGFVCINCQKWVLISSQRNTLNRNHCPHCLWSKHVDEKVAGDRMASCNTGMRPIGLTTKTARIDKWGQEIKGEIMIIHECNRCGKISLNRILAEDESSEVIKVFETGIKMDGDKKEELKKKDIVVLEEKNREEIEKQIFGK
jgi:DNA-directed RNA polymerase subunit RPC12/RpoP